MFRDGFRKAVGNQLQGAVPVGFTPLDPGREQPSIQPDGLTKGRTLGTKPAMIGGVIWIAPHIKATPAIGPQQNTASDPAIGAG